MAQAPSAICEELRKVLVSPASPSSTCPPPLTSLPVPHHPPAAPACVCKVHPTLSPGFQAPVLCLVIWGTSGGASFPGYLDEGGAPVGPCTPISLAHHCTHCSWSCPGLTSLCRCRRLVTLPQVLVAEHS